jgi:hypothetical protein
LFVNEAFGFDVGFVRVVTEELIWVYKVLLVGTVVFFKLIPEFKEVAAVLAAVSIVESMLLLDRNVSKDVLTDEISLIPDKSMYVELEPVSKDNKINATES